jgi:hypothetical protein
VVNIQDTEELKKLNTKRIKDLINKWTNELNTDLKRSANGSQRHEDKALSFLWCP